MDRDPRRLDELRAVPEHVVVGLNSGTSADGVDAACVVLRDGDVPGTVRFRLVVHRAFPFEAPLQRRILDAWRAPASEIADLDAELGERFARAAVEVGAAAAERGAPPVLVGSHGQTLVHRPPAGGRRGASLQIGCPSTIAERTGLPVVADFRARDLAAGGHGAPLVPRVERLLFARRGRPRAFLNLGGVANLTLLGAPEDDPLACDVGPANSLLDALARTASAGTCSFDEDGAQAAKGRPLEGLVRETLEHPFFSVPSPKSLDREEFGESLARAWLTRGEAAADLFATAVEVTARAVALGLEQLVAERPSLRPAEVYVSGGGAANPTLRRAIERALGRPLLDTERLGLPGAAMEAVAFAVLARETLLGRPGNEPSVTGASRRVVLGEIVP